MILDKIIRGQPIPVSVDVADINRQLGVSYSLVIINKQWDFNKEFVYYYIREKQWWKSWPSHMYIYYYHCGHDANVPCWYVTTSHFKI